MSKHTLGPWEIQRQNPSPTTGQWMISGQKPGYLAEVRDCGSGDVEANARLIAAAPDLLETLIDAVELIEIMSPIEGDTLRRARAAIAKATGEQQ